MGKALKNLLNQFRGRETPAEEKKEKKMSPAAYAKGERMEGEKAKMPAKKIMKK
jgi:hypothetical protein